MRALAVRKAIPAILIFNPKVRGKLTRRDQFGHQQWRKSISQPALVSLPKHQNSYCRWWGHQFLQYARLTDSQ